MTAQPAIRPAVGHQILLEDGAGLRAAAAAAPRPSDLTALDTTPPSDAVKVEDGKWLIRSGGDTLGGATTDGQFYRAWRRGRDLGLYATLSKLGQALIVDEDAELAARRAARALAPKVLAR